MLKQISTFIGRRRQATMPALWILFALVGVTLAQSSVGYHGAPFLKISPAARQVAMGEAFSALSSDINLMRYNIGGLGGIEYPSLAVNFNTWIDDTQQGNVAFAYPFKKYGVIGADITYFDEGQIEQLDPFFNPMGGNGISGDIMFALGYGFAFSLSPKTRMSIGLAGKYLSQSLVGETSSSAAVDAGLQVKFYDYFALGAAVQNFGLSKMQFAEWQSPLPLTYRVGAALSLPVAGESGNLTELTLAADALYVDKEQIKYFLGGEIFIANVMALRGGYKFNETSMSTWATGFGLNVPSRWVGKSLIRLDYAYAPLAAFDEAAHRFSLHFAFGAAKSKFPEVGAFGASGISAEEAERLRKMQDELADQLAQAQRTAGELEALKKELEEKLAIVNRIIGEDPGKMRIQYRTDDQGVPIGGILTVLFDFDQAAIRPSEHPTMRRVGQILNTFPSAKVQLSGHTDWIGEEDYNIKLSQRRLESVMDYLSRNEKVNKNRFFMPVGYGESRPIADNRTEEGRQQNRRVEFNIYFENQEPEIPEGTAIRNVRALDANTIQIEFNGRVAPGKTLVLADPDRFAISFENIFLLTDVTEIPLNRGPFIRARLGFHGSAPVKFSRVVLDTQYPIDGTQTVDRNYIIFKRKAQLEQSLEKKN